MLCVYEGVMSIYSEYPVIHVTNFSQHSPKLWDLFRHTLLWVYEGVMSIYSEYPVIHLPNFTLHSPKLCDMFRHTSYEYTRVLRCIFWIFCYPCDELYAAFSKTVWYVPPHPLRVCILCVGVNLCRQRLFWTGRATQICCLRSSLKGQCQEIADTVDWFWYLKKRYLKHIWTGKYGKFLPRYSRKTSLTRQCVRVVADTW